jgi:hypothetical protein
MVIANRGRKGRIVDAGAMNLGWGSVGFLSSAEWRTYMPDAEDDPWGETRLPLGVLFDNSLHQSKELRGVILDLAVDL